MENIKVVNDGSPFPSRREGSKMSTAKHMYGNPQNYMSNKDDGSDLQQEERREISLNLNMLRKKFDEFREAAAKKEKEIAQMRDEIEKLKIAEGGLQDDTSRYSVRLEQLKNSLEMAKMKLEEAAMSKKTYDHMLERMKRDQLSYKLKSSKLETNLASVAHNYNAETEKARKHQQAYLESQFALDHLMKNIESENKQIEDNLENFKGMLKTKKASEEKREERIRHQQNVAETAATNKDSTERKWRKLLLVHKFLSVFLKRNMEREMSKYKVVEQAFQKIRAATAINDANEFVTKFLSRENTYSQLLISIAEYEQKLEELRKVNENQKNSIAALKNDTVFQDQGSDKRIMTAEIDKEFSTVNEKAKITKTTFEKVYIQGVKFMKKLNHAGLISAPSSGNLYENYPREKVADMYKLMETTLMPQLEELPEEKVDRLMSEVKRVPAAELKTEDFKKQVRVKAPSRQDSAHRSRSNSGRLDTDGSKGNLEITNEGTRQMTDENDDYLHEQRYTLKAEIDTTNKKRKAERPPSTTPQPARGAPQMRQAADVSKHQ